jgi:hypothetical protein
VKTVIRKAAVLPVPVCAWPATSFSAERDRERTGLDRRAGLETHGVDARMTGSAMGSEAKVTGWSGTDMLGGN